MAQEHRAKTPKENAIRFVRRISRLGHQVSGWEYRVATAGTFTTAFTLQALHITHPWLVYMGTTSYVLFGQFTCLYTLCDVAFTAVDITHDYIQVTQRRMAASSFLSGVKRKLFWCGARVTGFLIGGKVFILLGTFAVGGVTLVFVVGGLIGVCAVTLAQLSIESDFLNRMGTYDDKLGTNRGVDMKNQIAI
uniref:Uncharacterized protein n=1 Tax=Octactis speculum TaxID=3111310 RepID=A0A7S2HC44_9STRA|mmetsp:Transcript_63453/g.87232  ORF Transcript_63453/g.87232 Transcript_63453/m.87232 type:complete len:192 (+) Transcript_63453:69-644(+)